VSARRDAKRVHLLRHAKSSWADPGQADRERPLTPRGRRAARRLAVHLRESGADPDLVLCSPAARTMQTLELVRPGLAGRPEVLVEDGLYGASARELLARLRRLPDEVRAVLVVGHNPGLQELAVLLSREGELRARARDRFPTAALATLALRGDRWEALDEAGADLIAYVTPRALD
jgi:phosphohistidine phosphatase